MSGARAVIVDDHRIFREGVVALLNDADALDVVGQFDTVEDYRAAQEQVSADILILDISLEEGESLPHIQSLKAAQPGLKILVLSMHEDGAWVERAITAGADGYALKRDAYHDLSYAIGAVLDGGRFISPSVAALASRPAPTAEVALPERQAQIVSLIAQGKYNKEIASDLGIALSTVKNHLAALYRKFGVTSRVGLLKALDKIADD